MFVITLIIQCCNPFSKKQSENGRNIPTQIDIFLDSTIYEKSEKTKIEDVDLFFPLINEFSWTNIEKQNPELKAKFIKNLPEEFDFFKKNSLPPNFDTYLHIVDFNGDGLDDIIFNEFIANESKYIIIFINTGQSFEKIFSEHQVFHKIEFKDKKADKLYIRDGGCCCDYIGTNKIYKVNYCSELPKFDLVSQMQFVNISQEEYPSKYFDKPIKFEILNNKYNIRFSPIIDDTTKVAYCFDLYEGNSLGQIKEGSIGHALAEKRDSTGRIWWFVAMHPNSEIYEQIYYREEIIPNSYKMGWISSRFVKVIQ